MFILSVGCDGVESGKKLAVAKNLGKRSLLWRIEGQTPMVV